MENKSNETSNIWSQQGEYYIPGSTSTNTKKIPAGIYEFRTSDRGWFLEKTSKKYIFPFKLYGVNDKILKRVNQAYEGLTENIGIMLNGMKGTGKTVTAQQIINWAIDKDIIVLNVPKPVPLAMIMARVEQPMLVLFDEFEKTHSENEDQQNLLSAIDGLSRSEHRRIFLFTTNEKAINTNLIDRPSRIRYIWNFSKLDADMINELIDDLLDDKLKHLKPDILSYLNTRCVLSIDVVKTVIKECNAFKEAPAAFKSFMNMSEKEPSAYVVNIVEGNHTTPLFSYFRPHHPNPTWLMNLFTEQGKQDFLNRFVAAGSYQDLKSYVSTIRLLGPSNVIDEWYCNIYQNNTDDVWITPKLKSVIGRSEFWIDEKPDNWQKPSWAKKLENNEAMSPVEEEEYQKWYDSGSVYGGKPKKFLLQFKMDHTPVSYSAAYDSRYD